MLRVRGRLRSDGGSATGLSREVSFDAGVGLDAARTKERVAMREVDADLGTGATFLGDCCGNEDVLADFCDTLVADVATRVGAGGLRVDDGMRETLRTLLDVVIGAGAGAGTTLFLGAGITDCRRRTAADGSGKSNTSSSILDSSTYVRAAFFNCRANFEVGWESESSSVILIPTGGSSGW
jgi:hypothetical protein